MAFRRPQALQTPEDQLPLEYLRKSYKERAETPLGADYTGARFDVWDSTQSWEADADRFTADDLVAVSFLSVEVPPKAAWELLAKRPRDFNTLLAGVAGTNLSDVDPADINESWPAWQLWSELLKLRGVNWLIASKLLARKRPNLIPIYDRVVKTVTCGERNYWVVPLCGALRADHRALHKRLVRLHREAGLPLAVSPLRVFDVIARELLAAGKPLRWPRRLTYAYL